MSTKNILVGLVAVGLAAVASIWVWYAGAPESSTRNADVPIGPTVDVSSTQAASEPPAELITEVSAPALPARERTVIEDEQSKLTVVDGSTGLAVPGADVWYRESRDNWWDSASDREALVRLDGRHGTSDAAGRFELPGVGYWQVIARIHALYGEGDVYSGGEEAPRVELYPFHELTIQVVDASGVPQADVPVGIGSNVSGPTSSNGGVERAARRAAFGFTVSRAECAIPWKMVPGRQQVSTSGRASQSRLVSIPSFLLRRPFDS
jgi:hypothetical protein